MEYKTIRFHFANYDELDEILSSLDMPHKIVAYRERNTGSGVFMEAIVTLILEK